MLNYLRVHHFVFVHTRHQCWEVGSFDFLLFVTQAYQNLTTLQCGVILKVNSKINRQFELGSDYISDDVEKNVNSNPDDGEDKDKLNPILTRFMFPENAVKRITDVVGG